LVRVLKGGGRTGNREGGEECEHLCVGRVVGGSAERVLRYEGDGRRVEDVEPGSFGVEETAEDAVLPECGVEEGAVEEGREHTTTTGDESGVFLCLAGVRTGDSVGGEGVLRRERRDDEAGVEGAEGLAEGDKVRVAASHFSVL
jgi:hypothetical protein